MESSSAILGIPESYDDSDTIKLLLVDDDVVDRESITRMLNKFDPGRFEIDEASEYEQAVAMLSSKQYDTCLIDYCLDERNGIELLQSMQQKNPYCSGILLTGTDEEVIDKNAMRAGASDFICKDDVSPKNLGRTIRYSVHQKRVDRERDFLARHDPLTKLVNRTLFFDRLNHAVQRADRYNFECALLYIDIDEFKAVNDEYGHEAGDNILRDVAVRLKCAVRVSDTVARLGGDEFAILLEDVNVVDSHYVSQKILSAFEQAFIFGNNRLNVSISMGFTRFPTETQDVNQLLMQADRALYIAKKQGKKTYRRFDAAMKKDFDHSRWIEKEFPLALSRGLIHPHYQPQYCFATGKISGFEALARWHHPDHGYIPPPEFVAVAERHSLMSILTKTMLENACTDYLVLGGRFANTRIAVNVSASDCLSGALVKNVQAILTNFQLSPEQLELEVTETVLMRNIDEANKVLGNIHDMGVRIAIDDFGTEFSSMTYLTELPIDTLKIDLQFTQGIGTSVQKENVVQVIIDLAKRLGFSTVAEGVETEFQKEFLSASGCDYAQGYYYNKPLPLEQCLLIDS